MNISISLRNSLVLGLFGSLVACPVWRTEHKVETTHKIEAHIVIDVRKVEAEAQNVESAVRAPAEAPKPATEKPQSMLSEGSRARLVASRSLWSIFDLSTSAAAAEGDDEVKALERRKARADAIDRELTAGCLGENIKGLVEPRPCNAPEDKKKAAKQLAEDENKDRRTIYGATVVRDGHKLSEEGIEAVGVIYAKIIREKLKKGQTFQVPMNDERFKEFSDSPLGKKLAGAKKGEWVRVP